MKIVKTAKFKILSHTKSLEPTISIYNKALSFYIEVVQKEWDNLKGLKPKKQMRLLEQITHKTKRHPNVKYDFDQEFYKFPSYLRRACIMEAIGYYSSYDTNYKRWLAKREKALQRGKKFYQKPPTLNLRPNSFPVLYKKEVFKKLSEGKAKIKAYIDNDWKWIEIEYSVKNLHSSKEYRFLGYEEKNPMLVRKGKKYFLHIPYVTSVKLSSTPIDNQIVVGVDLGLTKSAVVSAINPSGTVIGRKFINQPIEKDCLRRKINRLSKAMRNSGPIKAPNYWRKINNLQKSITQQTANEIVKFAVKHNAGVIVFERLGKFKPPKGFYGAKRLRARLQYWAKRKIQTLTMQKAHSYGIRVRFVNPKGTSKFAYDGSGEVKRNAKKDICKFPNGKIYHADLNASYNIGARYFIKEYLKPLPETVRLQVEAKVPSLADRTSHSLASLIRLHEALSRSNGTEALASCMQVREAPAISAGLVG